MNTSEKIKVRPIKRVGVIGLGIMGKPIAERLLGAGFDLVVHSSRKESANELIAAGAIWANNPALLTKEVDAVLTMVGNPQEVEEVYLGTVGILSEVSAGQVLIDLSTTLPELAREIAMGAAVQDALAFDAPVTGGEQAAREGSLTIMAGTTDETIEQLADLFAPIAAEVIVFGEPGKGQMCKLANQIALGGVMMGLAESLAFAKHHELDVAKVHQAISTGMADSHAMRLLGGKSIAGDFAPGFKTQHIIKDLALALEAADEVAMNLPGTELAMHLYGILREIGGGELGTQALSLVYDREEVGSQFGLDWSILEQEIDEDDCGCDGHGCDHHHGDDHGHHHGHGGHHHHHE